MTNENKRCSIGNMRARLTKDFTFEAAQTLPNAPEGHKCRGVHGHSFKVEVSVEGDVDPKTGWVYDHARISDAMKSLMKMLDHAYLNNIEGLENPTIENMAEWFWKKLESQCPGLCEIVVHETSTARCVYRGEGPVNFNSSATGVARRNLQIECRKSFRARDGIGPRERRDNHGGALAQ
jgi:6-pyruvoyltetrahydropterin/6-carboxytetrahydropterin synthase